MLPFRFVLNTKAEVREQIEKKIKTCEDDIKKHEVGRSLQCDSEGSRWFVVLGEQDVPGEADARVREPVQRTARRCRRKETAFIECFVSVLSAASMNKFRF